MLVREYKHFANKLDKLEQIYNFLKAKFKN